MSCGGDVLALRLTSGCSGRRSMECQGTWVSASPLHRDVRRLVMHRRRRDNVWRSVASLLCAMIGACAGQPEVLPWPGWCGTSPSAMWQTIPCDASAHFALPEQLPDIAYPPVLEQAGISGHVVVALAIGESGSVDHVAVLASTNRGFNGGVAPPCAFGGSCRVEQ